MNDKSILSILSAASASPKQVTIWLDDDIPAVYEHVVSMWATTDFPMLWLMLDDRCTIAYATNKIKKIQIGE